MYLPGLVPLDPDSSSDRDRGSEDARSTPLREDGGAEPGEKSAGEPLALERRERRREAARWGEGRGVTRESFTQMSIGSRNGSTSSLNVPPELPLSSDDCEL